MKKVCVFFILIFLMPSTIFVNAADRLQLTAQRANNAPKLDGVITEEEWGEPIAAFSKDSEYIQSTSAKVDEERLPTGAELYTMWDAEYLFIGAIVTSATHQNTKKNAHIWEQDSLSLKIGLAENQAAEYRFIFALGGRNIPLGYLLCLPNEALDGTGGNIEVLLHYSDYFVARTDTETIYEIRLRWEDYTVDEREIEKGFQFYLEMELNTKGTKAGFPRTMIYGTYDDSNHWQYPMVQLEEQSIAPSQTPMPTATLAPTPSPTMKDKLVSPQVTPMNSLPLEPLDKPSEVDFWLYLLILAPLAIIAVAVIFIIKKRNHISK